MFTIDRLGTLIRKITVTTIKLISRSGTEISALMLSGGQREKVHETVIGTSGLSIFRHLISRTIGTLARVTFGITS